MGRRQPAFTLVELVLVLAIIVVMSAMAVPRYTRAQQRYRADAAAQRLLADLAMARSRANTTSTSQAVIFTVATSQYQMPGVTDLQNRGANYTVRLGDAPYQATLQSVDFGGGVTQVTFDGYGNPSSGGTLVITAGEFVRTILLNANTGKAALQ
jgi:prepilin-type N-terminal cleavage/methylation domain-containing protein